MHNATVRSDSNTQNDKDLDGTFNNMRFYFIKFFYGYIYLINYSLDVLIMFRKILKITVYFWQLGV